MTIPQAGCPQVHQRSGAIHQEQATFHRVQKNIAADFSSSLFIVLPMIDIEVVQLGKLGVEKVEGRQSNEKVQDGPGG